MMIFGGSNNRLSTEIPKKGLTYRIAAAGMSPPPLCPVESAPEPNGDSSNVPGGIRDASTTLLEMQGH